MVYTFQISTCSTQVFYACIPVCFEISIPYGIRMYGWMGYNVALNMSALTVINSCVSAQD